MLCFELFIMFCVLLLAACGQGFGKAFPGGSSGKYDNYKGDDS